MIEFPLRAPREISDRGERDGVHGAPNRNAQKAVGNVHRRLASTVARLYESCDETILP
jgi:hypothetical protein